MKPIVTVMKQNFRSNWLSLLLTAVVVLAATTANDAAMAISRGNYTWLLIILLPFFVVFFNFPKLMYLNTSKKAYLLGSLLTYTVAAAFVSLINTFIHLLIDPINRSQTVVNLMELCGWWKNGVLTAFLQQFLFLLLAAIFLHVLLSMQSSWFGWLADLLIAVILCVFVPIAPLRHLLTEFFSLILFNSNAFSHLLVCLCGCTILSLLGVAVLKRKTL